MDDAGLVRVGERVAHVAQQEHDVVHRQRSLAREAMPKRGAGLVRHHEVQRPAGFPGVEERHNVRMVELRDDRDLAQEPLGGERRVELRAHDLDGDVTRVLEVVREVDGRHPAAPELSRDAIALGKNLGEWRGLVVEQ